MNSSFLALKSRLMEIADLTKIGALLSWDQQTMMAPRGAAIRAEQMATLGKIVHEKFTADEIGQLLQDLREYEASLPYDSDEASLIRVARQDYEKQKAVPTDLRAEMTRAAALARMAWLEARKQSNFKIFLPYLEKNIELKRRYVECFAPYAHVYDPLLDDFERGMKTAEVKTIFDALKKELIPFLAQIRERVDQVSDACLHGHFPMDKQREFVLSILTRLGFQPEAWRLDPTVHPFATNLSINDIRLTTRYYEDYLSPALFGALHEWGHGLYENGIAPALERTLLAGGASSSLHESQSRMWENMVGRSRAFWTFFYPKLQAAFPEPFQHVELETFYRAINRVQPSCIRVEADEVTYGLHIIIRFELEQAMMEGTLALPEIPEAWNARMKQYLGVDVPNDAQGCLQDIHWAGGMLGYFPTYQLGNLVAAQLWENVLADIPDLYAQFERGEFMPLREWLREALHRHGRKFTPKETIQRAVGGPLDIAPYLRYLKSKFGEIYGINALVP